MSFVTEQGVYGASAEQLRPALRAGEFPVAVYGLGKMGLPLAGIYAETTGNVIGVDVDPTVVETVNDGACHVQREPGLAELIAESVERGRLRATTSPVDGANEASVHVVIVPVTLTSEREPDLSILEAVIADIGAGLEAGELVVIESTVPPRTTAEMVVPRLADESGLAKHEFGVAFCPERTSSGRALEDIKGAYPKVVGGVDKTSTHTARVIYEEINDEGVIPVSDATTAECVKVFEGLYRDVNIALANELATVTEEFGIDVREAIEVAYTQPYCDIHDPGPGVGGHCIPFYPYFVIDSLETDTPMLETARKVNESMPKYTVAKIREEFAAEGLPMDESSVLVLGLTYRPGVEEIRASPSLAIAEELTAAGVTVYGVDPLVREHDAFELEGLALSDVYSYDFDGVVLVTPHDVFDDIDWHRLGRDDGAVVIDGRDSLELGETSHRVYTIGRGYDV